MAIINPQNSQTLPASGIHRDLNDCRSLLACLFTFGKWKGGNLLTDLDYNENKLVGFNVQPGRILFLNSYLVKHWVSPITSGVRSSIVLTSHDVMTVRAQSL